MTRAALVDDATISDVEKAVIRMIAIKTTQDLTKAAKLVGMARVSLERWLWRRGGFPW